MTKTILILAANPKNTSWLRLDQEVREIDNGLQRARRRDEYILKQVWAMRPVDVRRAMLDLKPNIVHFCGHGGREGIVLENENGHAETIEANILAEFFELFADTVECVVFNVCYSEFQAEAVAQHIEYVIGTKAEINDSLATEFAVAFYDSLGAGYQVDFAYRLACNAIRWVGLSKDLTPIMISRVSLIKRLLRLAFGLGMAIGYFAGVFGPKLEPNQKLDLKTKVPIVKAQMLGLLENLKIKSADLDSRVVKTIDSGDLHAVAELSMHLSEPIGKIYGRPVLMAYFFGTFYPWLVSPQTDSDNTLDSGIEVLARFRAEIRKSASVFPDNFASWYDDVIEKRDPIMAAEQIGQWFLSE